MMHVLLGRAISSCYLIYVPGSWRTQIPDTRWWINWSVHGLMNKWTSAVQQWRVIPLNGAIIITHICWASTVWQLQGEETDIHWLTEFAPDETETVIIPNSKMKKCNLERFSSFPMGHTVWRSWDSDPSVLNPKTEFQATFSGCTQEKELVLTSGPCVPGRRLNKRTFRPLWCVWSLARASAWGLPKRG